MKRGYYGKTIILNAINKEENEGWVYTFKVVREATKVEIKKAFESMFGKKAKSVNTNVKKAESIRFKGRAGEKKAYKKAMIRLFKGEVLDEL